MVDRRRTVFNQFDYSRRGRQMSWRGRWFLWMSCCALATAALPCWAQYSGQVTKKSKDQPELRAVSVLEWTGEVGNPKACRLVPVTVLDAGELQDASVYLARPEPLAIAGEVEYELEQNGKAVGLFDIKNTGQEQGSWVAYGAWKPLVTPAPKPSMDEVAQSKIEDEDDDRPVLHRKKHAEDAPNQGQQGGSTGAGSSAPAPASDPDRPTLHKKNSSNDTADAGSNPSTGSSPSAGSAPAPDSDGPTLHKKDSSSDSSASAPADDPDRPTIKKSKKKQPEDIGHVESLPGVSDPDRPRLKRGKSTGNGLDVLPSLLGLPADMQQAVAVSDVKTRPDHPWTYNWANPEDEAKMKASLEEMARNALGLTPPPAPPALPAPKRTATRKTTKPASAPEPPPPAPLLDEQFRVFELSYGSGATLVLSAHTDGPLAQQKFVTLVAQPDLYGNVLLLVKSVTDGAHLDESPRMRLVDAVDALADNRGELLFELRGATQRQFALYRVLRGQAEKLFVTGGGEFGTESRN
jgi:hypothetical protein